MKKRASVTKKKDSHNNHFDHARTIINEWPSWKKEFASSCINDPNSSVSKSLTISKGQNMMKI